MPGATADRTSDAEVGRRPIRARLLSVVLRPTAPPLALGVVVAASFIIAETLLVYLLTKIVPEMALWRGLLARRAFGQHTRGTGSIARRGSKSTPPRSRGKR